jgi:hypothetical protein
MPHPNPQALSEVIKKTLADALGVRPEKIKPQTTRVWTLKGQQAKRRRRKGETDDDVGRNV